MVAVTYPPLQAETMQGRVSSLVTPDRPSPNGKETPVGQEFGLVTVILQELVDLTANLESKLSPALRKQDKPEEAPKTLSEGDGNSAVTLEIRRIKDRLSYVRNELTSIYGRIEL